MMAIKFRSEEDDVSDDRGSPGERIINVVFFDFDADDESSRASLMHLDSINNFLASSLVQKDAKGSIIHFRSVALYRVVTSLCSVIPVRNGVRGIELVNCPPPQKDGSETIVNAPIRRLRDRKAASNCPLSIFPARYIELTSPSSSHEDESVREIVEICRFHNYDAERGCLRSRKTRHDSLIKGCNLDHYHCHRCGEGGHRAIECTDATTHTQRNTTIVFRTNPDGSIVSFPFRYHHDPLPNSLRDSTPGPPALLVLGGRLRGRTLATCEMMPLLSHSSPRHWIQLPYLREHRGSHAACSPAGSNLAFVLGGGTADGNSDSVEVLDFTERSGGSSSSVENGACQRDFGIGDSEWQWRTMNGRLSSPRHAFGAVSCTTVRGTDDGVDGITSVSIFAVGGWKYGAVSCESVERLSLRFPKGAKGPNLEWAKYARWEMCAPLNIPRRLHSVVSSTDGSFIYVLGGYVDERRTTSSIERYDVHADTWTAVDELPFHDQNNYTLVQAVADVNGGILIFPFSTEKTEKGGEPPLVIRYTPGSDSPFLPIHIPRHNTDKHLQHLRLPIANWHSFSVARMTSSDKAFLVGGTINGKWTNRCYELDLISLEWTELPAMTCPRRRLAAIVLE
ncbi:hypothetical protein ACHAXA_008003 [Cyclostephanos tholiformis]|uniref:CCHC-type domain-containing protein n=1 Tax=Cyclostephanos tholiformis TaxID=382380 RepID=A0ABD3R2N8_9STRA